MNKQLEALITSEIADFFAGVLEIHTNPGGTNTVEEAQQQLTERVTRIASECEAALIAALEQKEEQRANWFQMAQKLGEDMDSAEKRIAELQKKPSAFRSDGGDISRDRIKEIADNPYGDEEKGWLARQVLDASPLAVRLPTPSMGVVQSGKAVMIPYSGGHWLNKTAVKEAIRAAGGTVDEGE